MLTQAPAGALLCCSELSLVVSLLRVSLDRVIDLLLALLSDLNSVVLVLNDGVKVQVERVGDEEAEPLHGEVPVLKLVVFGDLVVLLEAVEGVGHHVSVVEEGDQLDDVDDNEAHHVHVVHDATPHNEEPDHSIVVSSSSEHPDDSSRDPLGKHEDGVNVLRETPHGVGVHSDEIIVISSHSVLSFRSIPELVVVVLEPEEA